MSYTSIEVEQQGAVRRLWLNRPQASNAQSRNMLDELDAERVVADAPRWLQPYLKLDVEGFARDQELGGDIVTAETPEGGVWVWSG